MVQNRKFKSYPKSTKEAISEYLNLLARELEGIPKSAAEEIIQEVYSHIEDSIKVYGDNPRTVRAILEDLGDPREYAENLVDADCCATGSGRSLELKSTGRILGIPYDVGYLSAKKIASRIWNPTDPRIFVPKFLGIGWDINFGAIAVKLGLIRPDDDEEPPFLNVPDRAINLSLLLPIALNLISILIAAVFFNRFTVNMPTHYNFAGRPDAFLDPEVAFAWWIGPSIVMMFILYFFVFAKKGAHLARVLSVSFLTSISTMTTSNYINSIYYVLHGKTAFFASLTVLGGVVVFFIMLIFLSKLGLRAEWKRMNVLKAKRDHKGVSNEFFSNHHVAD